MLHDEPHWWYGSGVSAALIAAALTPVSIVYRAVAKNRYRRSPAYKAALPVICIGNLTAGGTGKTPLSIHIATLLKEMGEQPAFLTRGYGGTLKGPVWVDDTHDAIEAGDEPLLLKRTAPVMISADRAAGAKAIGTGNSSISVIVMDDGLQNPSLTKDLAFAVIDGARGVGNGRVIPAGPLRASLKFQNKLADVYVINGPLSESASAGLKTLFQREPKRPILNATMVATGDIAWLKDVRVFAYAGIGYPQRFFETLKVYGATISGTAEFRDHQVPTPVEAAELIRLARSKHALLVTTEKDFVRLPASGHQNLMDLKALSKTLPIEVMWDNASKVQLARLISERLKRRRAR